MTLENIRTATEFEICEASIVSVPADHMSHARNMQASPPPSILPAPIQVPIVYSSHNDTTHDNFVNFKRDFSGFYAAIAHNETPNEAQQAAADLSDDIIISRILEKENRDTFGMSRAQQRNAAITSQTMQIIGQDIIQGAAMKSLEVADTKLAPVFSKTDVPDLHKRLLPRVETGGLELTDSSESDEIKFSSVGDSGETLSASFMRGGSSITLEANINSQGKIFASLGKGFGDATRTKIAARKVAHLEENDFAGSELRDGKHVFSADRGNIAEMKFDPEQNVTNMLKIMTMHETRKDAFNQIVGYAPEFLICHPDNEEAYLRMLTLYTANTAQDIPILANRLKLIVEPRLKSPNHSWLVTAPAKMDGATRVYLEGYETPVVDSRVNFMTDALEFKIRLAFGLGWLEWRSWTRIDHGAD